MRRGPGWVRNNKTRRINNLQGVTEKRGTGPPHARAHAELNRCGPKIAIKDGGSVRVEVGSGDPAWTGRPLHMPVDRIGLTRQNCAYDARAAGTIHDLERLLRDGPGKGAERGRKWVAEWLAETTGVDIERPPAGTNTRLAWRRRCDGERGDEYSPDTAAAALAPLAFWATMYTGVVAIELPEAGLTHGQTLEVARLLAALGADGCDVRISTDSNVVLEQLGAIATDSHVRRTGERGGTLPRQDQIRAWRIEIDGDAGEPGPAVGNIWNESTGTWSMGNHATWTKTHNRWANAQSRKNDGKRSR